MSATAEEISVQRAADELVAAFVQRHVAEQRGKPSELLGAVSDVDDLLLKVTAGAYQALITLYDQWDHRYTTGKTKTLSVAVKSLGFQEIDLVVPDRGDSLPLVIQLLRAQSKEFAKKLAQAPGSLRAVEYWVKHILFDGNVPKDIPASSSSLGEISKELDSEALNWLNEQEFHDKKIWAVMLDGLEVQGRTVVVARGVTDDGRMLSLGAVEDQTENGEMVAKLVKGLIAKGVSKHVVWRIDGGKGLKKGIEDACGDVIPTIQRDVEHKVRNVLARLPDDPKRAKRASWLPGTRKAKNSRGSKAAAAGVQATDRGPHAEYRTEIRARMYAIWNNTPTVEQARAQFDALAQEFRDKAKRTRSKSLKRAYNAAATTLLNDIDSTLTMKRLGFTGRAARSLQTTNDVENDIRTLRFGNAAFDGLKKTTNFDQDVVEDGEMRLRHVARGLKAIDSTPKLSLTPAGTAVGRRALLREMERPTLSFDGVDIDITRGEGAVLAEWWLSPVDIDSRAGPDDAPADSTRVDGTAQWMGSAVALEQLGIMDPTGEVTVAGLASAHEGRHLTTNTLVRAMPPRTGKNQGASLIRNLHFELSASSNLARAWHGADPDQRADIERRMMASAELALEALEEDTRPARNSFAAVGKVQVTYDGSDATLPRLRVVGFVFGLTAQGKRNLLFRSPAQAKAAQNTGDGRKARVAAERLAATYLEDLQPLIEPFQSEFASTFERAQAGVRPARDERVAATPERSGPPEDQYSLLDLLSVDEADAGAPGAIPDAAPQPVAEGGVVAPLAALDATVDTTVAAAQQQPESEAGVPRSVVAEPELLAADGVEPAAEGALPDLVSVDEVDAGALGAVPEAQPQSTAEDGLDEPHAPLDTTLASVQQQSESEGGDPRSVVPEPELLAADGAQPAPEGVAREPDQGATRDAVTAASAPVPDRLELTVAGQPISREQLAGLVVERSLLGRRQSQRVATQSLWPDDAPRLAGVPIQAELRFRGQAPPTLTLSLAGVAGTVTAAPVPTSRSRAAALIDRLERAAIAELPAVMERAAELAARPVVEVSPPADDRSRPVVEVSPPADDRSAAAYTWTLGDQETTRDMVAAHIMGSAWQALPKTSTNGLGVIRRDRVLEVDGFPVDVALRREDGATKVVVGVSGRPETEVTGALSNRVNGGLTLVEQFETRLRAVQTDEPQAPALLVDAATERDQFWMKVGNEVATSRERASELVTQAVLQRARRAPDRTRELPVGEVGRLAGVPIRAAYVRRGESTHVALWVAGMRQTEVAMPLAEFRTDARALLERLEKRVAALPATRAAAGADPTSASRRRPVELAAAEAASVAGASFSTAGTPVGASAQHEGDRVPRPRLPEGKRASLTVGD